MKWIRIVSPLIFSSILLVSVQYASTQTLGQISRYGIGGLSVLVILSYVVVAVYGIVIRLSYKVESLVWEDLFEKHSDGNSIEEEEFPGTTAIICSYIAHATRMTLKRNATRASYQKYKDEMIGGLEG